MRGNCLSLFYLKDVYKHRLYIHCGRRFWVLWLGFAVEVIEGKRERPPISEEERPPVFFFALELVLPLLT